MHATAVLAADYSRTLDVAETTAIVGRAQVQTGTPVALAPGADGVDLFFQPRAHLLMTDRRWTFEVRDSLALTVPDLELGIGCASCNPVQTYDFASVSTSWHDRQFRFGVTEEASGGFYNSENLLQAPAAATPAVGSAPPATVPVQLQPAPTTITTGSTRTIGSVDVRVDREATTSLSLSYLVSGGLDAPSQALLPLQHTARADASFTYVLSRRDAVATVGYAQDTQFDAGPCLALEGTSAPTTGLRCAPHDQLAQVGELWRRKVGRTTAMTLAGGIAVARSTGTGISEPSFWCNGAECVFPSGDVTVSSRFGHRGSVELTFDASLLPLVDVRTGLVSQRAQLTASLGDRITRLVSIRADCSGSQTVPPSDPLAATLGAASFQAGFTLSRNALLVLSQRALWEEQASLGGFIAAVTSVNVTVSSSVLRL